VVDSAGTVVPRANNLVTFSVSGPGTLVSTDNGDPTDTTSFPSASRNAFSGLVLAIVKANAGATGQITVSATANGITGGQVVITASGSTTTSTSASASTTTSTTTISSSTTTSTTSTTTTPSTGNCSAKWGQCAGQGWNGPTCCVSGSACTYQNPYYSQC
ncbi:hypothetical protein F66182_13619, partial [Fusarium sp. NRRL 66182]